MTPKTGLDQITRVITAIVRKRDAENHKDGYSVQILVYTMEIKTQSQQEKRTYSALVRAARI